MRTWTLALIAALVLTAGCLNFSSDPDEGEDPGPEQPPEVSADWHNEALPYGEEHDHTDPTHHQNLTTPNFDIVGWDPLETDYHGSTSGDYFCGGQATTDDRDLVVTHSFGTDVALIVVDVTDPQNPEPLSEIALPYAHVYDIDVTPDGAYAALGISEFEPATPDDGLPVEPLPWTPQQDAPTMQITSYCGDEPTTRTQEVDETPYTSGTLLVDLADPAQPEIADWRPQPVGGPHSVHAQLVDGDPVILSSITNLVHETAYFDFLTVEETPAGPLLVQQDRYNAEYPDIGPGNEPPLLNGHVDGWIAEHPIEETTYAYLAVWSGGMHVLEYEPTLGIWTLVAIWNDYDPGRGAGMTGQIHGTLPMETTSDDGKHYTWIGQEVGDRPSDRPTGNIIKMDTTDPTNPQPVARWTLPTDVEFNESLQFSTHYFQIVDDTLFVAMYHGGVWAVGTEPINDTHQLPTKGAFIPDRTPPNPPNLDYTFMDDAPVVLDVLTLPTGELVVMDGASGVYTVAYDDTVDVPQPEPWTQDDWSPDQGQIEPIPR